MKLRALVVDDSQIMRKMVMEALRQTGVCEFEFTEAEDGEDALDKFSPQTIDIAFVDWNMPNLSGLDFIHKIRRMSHTQHIPILMVTSEKTMGKMEVALGEGGADGYVCKPFTVEDLRRRVVRALQARPPRSSDTAQPTNTRSGFFSRLRQGI